MADTDAALTRDEEIRRAGKAREILENEIFKGAVRKIEEALVEAIHRSAFTDDKLREKLCQRLASLRDIVDYLHGTMTSGTFAQMQIEAEEKQKKRFKIF